MGTEERIFILRIEVEKYFNPKREFTSVTYNVQSLVYHKLIFWKLYDVRVRDKILRAIVP